MKDNGSILLAAHRGDRKNYPENTMPAFEATLEAGVEMIETDVHMTADDQLVLIHDPNGIRTTGTDCIITQMTLEEVRRLDAGKVFADRFRGVRIPLAEELMDLMQHSGLLVNWELKDYPCDVGDERAFAAADRLADLLIERGLCEQSMFNSFSDRVLEHVVQKYGRIFAIHGQGIHRCQRTCDKAAMPQSELYDWCCLYPEEAGQSPVLFPENFAYCLEHDVLPCVCIRDELETYQKAVELGCRMFTSNDIHEADRILRRLGCRA